MNLIEELGIEKAREIVDGAPEGSLIFLEIMPECDYHAYFAKSSEFSQETAMIWDRDGWVGVDDGAIINARLDHAPYIKIEDLRTAIAEHEPKMHSHLTSGGLQGDDTDDCTDIRNHISPLTGVIER